MKWYLDRKRAPYLIAAAALALAFIAFGLGKACRNVDARADTSKGRFVIVTNLARPRPSESLIEKPPERAELPESDRAKITGTGALDSASYFSCWITNQTSWTLLELRFRVRAGQPDGMARWDRRYNEQVHIPPGKPAHIYFKVTGGRDAEMVWEVTGARGIPPG